jgi:hypothetical protein
VNDSSVAAKAAFWSFSGLAIIAIGALLWRSILRRRHGFGTMAAVSGSATISQPGAAPFGPPQQSSVISPQPGDVTSAATPAPGAGVTPPSYSTVPSTPVQPGVISPSQGVQSPTEPQLPGTGLPPAGPSSPAP